MDRGLIAAKTILRGNCLPLWLVPQGTLVFNVGLKRGGKGQLCRGAGTFAMVVGNGEEAQQEGKAKETMSEAVEEEDESTEKETKPTHQLTGLAKEKANQQRNKEMYINVKLKSGEVRRIHREACATVGTASNSNYNRRQLGKAGRSRWLGIRPTVRGLAMNASDHPHGGGRGKGKGNVQSQSAWGTLVRYFLFSFPFPSFLSTPCFVAINRSFLCVCV